MEYNNKEIAHRYFMGESIVGETTELLIETHS
jgi:hypothetical protein